MTKYHNFCLTYFKVSPLRLLCYSAKENLKPPTFDVLYVEANRNYTELTQQIAFRLIKFKKQNKHTNLLWPNQASQANKFLIFAHCYKSNCESGTPHAGLSDIKVSCRFNSPWSLDRVDSRAWGFEGFRLGTTFGFRVAIILVLIKLRVLSFKKSKKSQLNSNNSKTNKQSASISASSPLVQLTASHKSASFHSLIYKSLSAFAQGSRPNPILSNTRKLWKEK